MSVVITSLRKNTMHIIWFPGLSMIITLKKMDLPIYQSHKDIHLDIIKLKNTSRHH